MSEGGMVEDKDVRESSKDEVDDKAEKPREIVRKLYVLRRMKRAYHVIK